MKLNMKEIIRRKNISQRNYHLGGLLNNKLQDLNRHMVIFCDPLLTAINDFENNYINNVRGYPMMGAAMLKRHRFAWSLWALYRLVV